MAVQAILAILATARLEEPGAGLAASIRMQRGAMAWSVWRWIQTRWEVNAAAIAVDHRARRLLAWVILGIGVVSVLGFFLEAEHLPWQHDFGLWRSEG